MKLLNVKSNTNYRKDDISTVKELLAKGADVNVKTNHGETALYIAKAGGHSEVAQLLIKAGAKK